MFILHLDSVYIIICRCRYKYIIHSHTLCSYLSFHIVNRLLLYILIDFDRAIILPKRYGWHYSIIWNNFQTENRIARFALIDERQKYKKISSHQTSSLYTNHVGRLTATPLAPFFQMYSSMALLFFRTQHMVPVRRKRVDGAIRSIIYWHVVCIRMQCTIHLFICFFFLLLCSPLIFNPLGM